MSFKKKIGAIAAASAMAAGVGLAIAAPASAGTGDSQRTVHAANGLGGSVTVRKEIGNTLNIAEGKDFYWSVPASSPSEVIKEVRAGSGYCVWEQSYRASNGNPRGIKVVDTTYGKSVSSRYHVLGSYNRINDPLNGAEALTTDLRIYAC